MVGSKCNLKMHVRNLEYPFPLQIGGPKTTFLGRFPNLTVTLTAYIFGTKHDIASTLYPTIRICWCAIRIHPTNPVVIGSPSTSIRMVAETFSIRLDVGLMSTLNTIWIATARRGTLTIDSCRAVWFSFWFIFLVLVLVLVLVLPTTK